MSAQSSDRPDQPPRAAARRWMSALGIALAFHLAVLVLFLGGRPRTEMGEGVGAGAVDVFLSGPLREAAPAPPSETMTPSKAPAPPAPPDPESPIKPRSVVQIVSEILNIPLQEPAVEPQPLSPSAAPTPLQTIAAASGTPGAPCDIGGAIQKALQTDPETHGAVLLIPRKERSAANAVLLWNGQWSDPSEVGGAVAFAKVRAGLVQIVAAAHPECRRQEIIGPRFMLVPEADTTMVVVVGNASWRWSDLLDDPPVPIRDGLK